MGSIALERKIHYDIASRLINVYTFYPIGLFAKFSQGELIRNIFTECKNFILLCISSISIFFN